MEICIYDYRTSCMTYTKTIAKETIQRKNYALKICPIWQYLFLLNTANHSFKTVTVIQNFANL